ncbi:MAG TPA: phosphoglycerate mutase family protein [Planctomycetota bacterium]|nr:phosphoglycerate mutase family protein [Planctomycetota bacterium]
MTTTPTKLSPLRGLRWLAALLLIGATIVAAAAPKDDPLTVVLVRHAERADAPADDPPLSADGLARAEELARVLGKAGVDAIYVSSLVRTGQTAAPLAEAMGLTPVALPIVETAPEPYVADLIARLRDGHWGQTVLVVSHSHTVPMIAEQLGAPTGPLGNVYDRLFVITVPRDGEPTLIAARYGAAN